MKTVAIYARFSSDKQNPRSADDQIDLCRKFTERRWQRARIVGIFKDEALRGTDDNRPGIQALLRLVNTGNLDVVLTESVDRMTRSLRFMAEIFEQLEAADTLLFTLSDGHVDFFSMGIRGTFSASAVKEQAKKIVRGKRASALRGNHQGFAPFGYRNVNKLDHNNRLVTGQRSINPKQAATVRHIFQSYASGEPMMSIVRRLNANGLRTSKGQKWSATACYYMLKNPIYIGKLRFKSADEWITVEREDLRIVDNDV